MHSTNPQFEAQLPFWIHYKYTLQVYTPPCLSFNSLPPLDSKYLKCFCSCFKTFLFNLKLRDCHPWRQLNIFPSRIQPFFIHIYLQWNEMWRDRNLCRYQKTKKNKNIYHEMKIKLFSNMSKIAKKIWKLLHTYLEVPTYFDISFNCIFF